MDAQLMGLLSGAASGLEASGPSRMPVSMGQVLSRGLLGGMQAYQGQEDRNQRQGLLAAQLGQLKLQEEVHRENMRYQQQQREQALLLQRARAGIFGDPGVSPQDALAGGGGPTNANAGMIRPPNPMAINPQGAQRYLMAGGDPKVLESFQNLGPQGRINKIDLEKFEAPSVAKYLQSGNLSDLVPRTKREAVTTAGPDGSPITRFIDMYNPPADSLPQPIKREAVNSGGQTDFVNPYAQTSPMARTASPDSVLSANVSMRGQNMTDARAGQVFDPERGMVVDTRGGTASPVMAGGAPIGPKDKALTDAQAKALLFSNRMEASDSIIGGLASGGTNATYPGMMGTGNANAIINAFAPADQQQLSQAKRDFVNAVLRRESGAVIAPSEFANADKQYFPQIGDSAEVRAQKAANRKAAIDGIKAEVPKTYAGPDRRAPAAGGAVSGFRVLGVERP